MIKVAIKNLSLFYDTIQALKNISLNVEKNEILGVIGPANSGKSSFLRALNRLYEIDYARISGTIVLDDTDIFTIPINDLRRRVGLIFATPVVLPGSSIIMTSGPIARVRAIHKRCCCPPDNVDAESFNLSFTSFHRLAAFSALKTILSSSPFSNFLCSFGP
ncbi:hypothetical protein ES708_31932 [subsurface metagenome]